MALHPTFLRERLFQYLLRPLISRETFCVSMRQSDMQKVPRAFVVEGLTEAVSYTAKWLKSSSETGRILDA